MDIEKIKNNVKKLGDAKSLRMVIYILIGIIIAFLIFQSGISVGERRAQFTRNWGNNYYNNFGPRQENNKSFGGGMMVTMFDEHLPNPNGASGKIIKLNLPSLIVQDLDNTEKVIVINDDTQIIRQRDEIKSDELNTDDFIVVIGNPNDLGQIEARLIRVMPVPPVK